MKKIKLLTPILGITTIATATMPLASCNKTEKFTVRFDSKGGSTLADVTVDKDSTVAQPENPIWEGHSFKGWYIDEQYTTPFDFNTKITGNIILFAKWVDQHTITFSASDGITLTGELTVKVDDKTKWKDVVKPQASSSIEGYQQLGWYDGIYEIEDDTEITSDLSARCVGYDPKETLVDVTITTAKQTYNCTYLQGATWGSFKLYYAEEYAEPELKDHTFIGWYVGDTKLTDSWVFPEGQLTSNITAKFTENDHKVYFTCSDGATFENPPSGPTVVSPGTTWGEISKPTVNVSAGYYGVGWYDKNLSTELTDDTPITTDIQAKYYAWDYTGAIIDVYLIIDGKQVTRQYIQNFTWAGFKEYWDLQDPVKEGYTFDGWYSSDTKLTDDWTFPEQPNVNIEARFIINKYTVNFAVDDGATFVGSSDPVQVEYKTKWKDIKNKPQVSLKFAHIADGWYNSLGKMTDDTEILGDSTITYRTIDLSKTKINVSIKVNGKVLGTTEYARGATWGQFKEEYEITDPEVEGFYFDGWTYNGEKISDNWTFPFDVVDCTIEAKLDASFAADTWENVCKYANQGIDKLHQVYSHDLVDGKLIGLTRTLKINNIDHVVRVIDEQHDEIDGTSTKAALTFDLVTLLSDSEGNAIQSCWNDYESNTDYLHSNLRKNLNGSGNEQSYGLWDKSALEMIQESEPILFNNIKSVKKEVAQGSSYSRTKYVDKLFPLTFYEMDIESSRYAPSEGSRYTYWTQQTSSGWLKYDANGNESDGYWLATPYTRLSYQAWRIFSGYVLNVGANDVVNSASVTFGFCI